MTAFEIVTGADKSCYLQGICVTVLKKLCRKFGIVKWPYKQMRRQDPVEAEEDNSGRSGGKSNPRSDRDGAHESTILPGSEFDQTRQSLELPNVAPDNVRTPPSLQPFPTFSSLVQPQLVTQTQRQVVAEVEAVASFEEAQGFPASESASGEAQLDSPQIHDSWFGPATSFLLHHAASHPEIE